MTCGVECFYDCWKLSLIGARLCRLVREINLDKHVGSSIQFACDSVEPFSQLNAIDRMNNIKRLDCLPSLIRLKMTDQMPARAAVDLSGFAQRFLNAILAEVSRAGVDCLLYCVWIECF